MSGALSPFSPPTRTWFERAFQAPTPVQERGWAAISPDRFRLTPQGLRFADSAAELFLR